MTGLLNYIAKYCGFPTFHGPMMIDYVGEYKDARLDNDDKLIVVKINGSARAHPIREMGYHHVVNDVVGGTAVAATY